MDPIEIEFVLSPDDVIALRRFERHRLPDGRRTSRVDRGVRFLIPFALLLLLVFTLCRGLTDDRPEQRSKMTTYVFLGLLILFNVVFILRQMFWAWLIRRAFRKAPPNSPLTATRKASISTESLSIATPLVSNTYRWGAISRIAFLRDQVFLFTGPHNAHIIPRQAFADETEWGRLNELLRKNYPGQIQDETQAPP